MQRGWSGRAFPVDLQYDFNVAEVTEVWRRGSVVRSVAARPDRAGAEDDPKLEEVRGLRRATPARAAGRCRPRSRRGCRRPCSRRVALRRASRSRGESSRGERVLSACGTHSAAISSGPRSNDGDHASRSGKNPLSRGSRLRARRTRARSSSSARPATSRARSSSRRSTSLACRQLLRRSFAHRRRRAHRRVDDESWREDQKQAVREYVARRARRGDVGPAARRHVTTSRPTSPTTSVRGRASQLVAQLDRERGTGGNRVFYLAVPPRAFGRRAPRRCGRRTSGKAGRASIIEKPFGHDLASARALNDDALGRTSTRAQIFRIDHYLGKETVQNILVLRFANGIFEPLWNRHFIDHVQITVAEAIGVEGRGGYYERPAPSRDMVQNHLLQLLALTAMEPPVAFEPTSVRDEKVKVLQALRPIAGHEVAHVVRGQYGRGFVEGEAVPGYREEQGVAPDSTTETYVAPKFYIDNWRWAACRSTSAAGKRLPTRRRDRDPVQGGAAPAVREETAATGCARTCCRPHPARRGHLAQVRLEGAGADDDDPPVQMEFRYGDVVRHRAAGGVRAADPRLHPRRRDAVHARRRGRGAVGDRRRDRRVVEARPAGLPRLPGRGVGAPAAEELVRRDGREVAQTLKRNDDGLGDRGAPSGGARQRDAVAARRVSRPTWRGYRPSGRGRPTASSRGWGRGSPRGRWCSIRILPGRTGSTRRSTTSTSRAARRRSASRCPSSAPGAHGDRAGERRRSAPDRRPAGVPPLARPAAARAPPVRPAARRHRPAHRRFGGVGPAAERLREARRRVRAGSSSDLAWARTLPWRAGLANALAGDQGASRRPRDRPEGRGAPLARLARDRAAPATSG